MDRIKEFADRLKELMEIGGETVKSLAEKTNVPDASIYGYLSGQHIPQMENTVNLADYFAAPLGYFFGFCDEYVPKKRRIVSDVKTRVKAAIDGSGKTRYRLSVESQFNQTQLLRWYHGTVVPSLVSLVGLAEVLDCSLDYLAGREE